MMGKADRRISFSDYWLTDKIPQNSYWNKLREWGLEHIDENVFQSLYSYYGRTSVPPIYTFLAMLIQMEKGYSDLEMEGETTFDDRIKYAITAPRDFEGIDAVTLCDHRKRLFNSKIGNEIFINIINEAKESGLFDEDNLNVIDSFMVWGKSAKQDTYTMIYNAIKMVLKFTSFYGFNKDAEKQLKRNDYNSKRKKPEIDWTNKNEKIKLLDELVKDALSLIEYIKTVEKENGLETDIINAYTLLEKVATQDVEKDDNGNFKMIQGTAKDRIISINDSEMRHGHKTTSKQQDGYKAEIITGGKNGEFIIALDVFPANKPDGTKMDELLDESKENGIEVETLYGDSAYANLDIIEEREKEGMDFFVKIPKASNKKGFFTKDEFIIDVDEGTVKCPGGNIEKIDKQKTEDRKPSTVSFGSKCKECSMRNQCTEAKNGRQITIHKSEGKLQKERKRQSEDEFKNEYVRRANGERDVSELTKHGGRKSKHIGQKPTKQQLIIVAINNNIKKLMGNIFKNLKTFPQAEYALK
ncbi:MAG: transposase [Clostridia bacterium]|nr:transposase [Clostridia bacterium]